MKNYKFTVRYDGTRYDGWQKQGNTDKTIQGKLEQILTRMCGEPVEVQGSGRTDAGVHALAQVANAHMETALTPRQIQDYMNQYLPADISVDEVTQVHGRFHSRLNARTKTYCYRIYVGKNKPVFQRNYVWHNPQPLSLPAMQKAAAYLVGQHDFQSFCANSRMKKSTVRTIYGLTVECREETVVITATGNGFLYHMVRILAGTLWEVGAGARKPEEIPGILEQRSRQAAGPTAPAQGLMLMGVTYDD